jgi:2-C-methyl-D-erythritol 4-phosphate cytidylyltransferase / 2-C-methyl-D-erythritol 2,4-cyclodiphosphate synthase
MRCVALLMAAGSGSRFGAPQPKQYSILAGRPVIRHAAEALLREGGVDALLPICAPDMAATVTAALEGLPFLAPVAGGATRQASVRAGLEALAGDPPSVVLVHDAARPVVPAGTVAALMAALEDHPGAIPAQPVSDTLKRGNGGLILETVPRAGLFRAQTPQAFRFELLLAAHRGAAAEATDDAQLLEAAGLAVVLVPGHESNVKITWPEDLARMEAALREATMSVPMIPRIGTGFDVHRIVEGRPMVLCGVVVPGPLGLDGHSDADVGIHALCDAIYGALAEGDIGRWFPPSDNQYKDADSARFPGPCGRADRGAGRRAGQCGCDTDLRAAEDHAPCDGDAGEAGGPARGAGGPRLREGDDDGAAGLRGAWRGDRGAGGGVGAGAGVAFTAA